jgi:SAM-dependent methyltransferase
VLVVGCNRGQEVAQFIGRGADAVTGIDVLEDVGADFEHPHVVYHRMSAEAMTLGDDLFDIVYCVATMEHVQHPTAAFAEIARVTAPRGLAYVVSAPLWHSRQGHHKGDLFDVDRYPWLHLRYTADEIKGMCDSGEIEILRDVAGPHVDYMLDPANMSQLAARSYVAAAGSLDRMVVERNELDLEGEDVLELVSSRELDDLAADGIDSVELRALTHMYIAWKDEAPTDQPAESSRSRRSIVRRLRRRQGNGATGQ